MSADRWSICPKCLKIADERKAKLLKIAEEKLKIAEENYGKIPADEYEKQLIAARTDISSIEDKIDISIEGKTLREDFGFELKPSGLFSGGYFAACAKCGFKHKYSYSKQLEI